MFVSPFDKDWAWDGAHCPLRRTGPLDEKTRPPFENNAFGRGDGRHATAAAGGMGRLGGTLAALTTLVRASACCAGSGPFGRWRWAPENVRGASVPQAGQAHGSRNSAIVRIAVNGPHAGQS